MPASSYDQLDSTEHITYADNTSAHGSGSPSHAVTISENLHSKSRINASGGNATNDANAKTEAEAEAEAEISETSTLPERMWVLFENASPIIVTFFLSLSGSFVNLIFCGHLSTASLKYSTAAGLPQPTTAQIFAAISLANMYANVTYRSIIIGLTGGIETLGSQNNGAGNYREVGLTLWRSVVILAFVALPCLFSWQYSYEFFRLMNIDPVVCQIISVYLQIRSFEMPLGVVQESFEKYLMSVQVFHPPLYAAIHFNISLVILNFLFLYGNFQFGYRGLGYAWVLSQFASLCTLVAMAWRHPNVQRTLVHFHMDVLKIDKLQEFIGLGLPGMLMLLSEWWAYEVLSIFAGLLGTPEVAAQTIILSTAALAYMVPLGLGIATASLVGNALGAGKKQLSIEIAHLSYQVVLCLTTVLGLVILFFGQYFVKLFTDDESVLSVASSVMSFLSLFVVFDGCNAVCSGILRGTGKQNVGACTNVISYYLFGLPCAWLLCFNAHWGVKGLMMGLSAGTLGQVVSLSTMIYCFQGYIFTAAIKPPTSFSSSSSSSSSLSSHDSRSNLTSIDSPLYDCNSNSNSHSNSHSSTSVSSVRSVNVSVNGDFEFVGRAGKAFVIEEIGDGDDDWVEA